MDKDLKKQKKNIIYLIVANVIIMLLNCWLVFMNIIEKRYFSGAWHLFIIIFMSLGAGYSFPKIIESYKESKKVYEFENELSWRNGNVKDQV